MVPHCTKSAVKHDAGNVQPGGYFVEELHRISYTLTRKKYLLVWILVDKDLYYIMTQTTTEEPKKSWTADCPRSFLVLKNKCLRRYWSEDFLEHVKTEKAKD